jgi:hypothetical protein
VHDFPLTVWHYRLRLPVEGADRHNLPDCLEEEELGLFERMDRGEAMEAIRAGRLDFDVTLEAPMPSFREDLATLSLFLFQVVKGFEVAERFVAEGRTDDARAWKIVARRGEWVEVPLVVADAGDGTFQVDEDADDVEILAARWASYPEWFRDGMRRKHPGLRPLP